MAFHYFVCFLLFSSFFFFFFSPPVFVILVMLSFTSYLVASFNEKFDYYFILFTHGVRSSDQTSNAFQAGMKIHVSTNSVNFLTI